MTKILINPPASGMTDAGADIVVITGDYGPTPVKAMLNARAKFEKPVVLIAGKAELDGPNLIRRLSEGRRQSAKWGRLQFLEQRAEIVKGIRFIGSHNAGLGFILAALRQPHDGPTVIVTYEAPPPDISAVTRTGKVARWIHPSSFPEPLVLEV